MPPPCKRPACWASRRFESPLDETGGHVILSAGDSTSIAVAASRIRAGGLLGLPTETVYGLAANADDDAAVAQIFKAKGRPADHPLIVHVLDAQVAAHYAIDIPDFAKALMKVFWPGPLTLILPRRPGVATAAAGGNSTIGLRCPKHPVAQALLKALLDGVGHGEPSKATHGPDDLLPSMAWPVWGLAAPSANQFGRVSPTTAQHVQGEFGQDLLILDGGPCSVGIESTIIDCTRGQPVLLRPGAITPEQAQTACGLKVLLKEELSTFSAPAPKASGTLESHYAPRARVRLLPAAELPLAQPGVAVWSRKVLEACPTGVLWRAMPTDASIAAQQLFAVLRDFDAQGVREIWIENPPDTSVWDGVRDRLQRAAH